VGFFVWVPLFLEQGVSDGIYDNLTKAICSHLMLGNSLLLLQVLLEFLFRDFLDMQVFALLPLFGLQTHQNQPCVTLCQCPSIGQSIFSVNISSAA